MSENKIDFKKCPECGSDKVDSAEEDPHWIIGDKHFPDHFIDPMECYDCKSTWQISYYPHSIIKNY